MEERARSFLEEERSRVERSERRRDERNERGVEPRERTCGKVIRTGELYSFVYSLAYNYADDAG